jgi:Ala-tRNA(Pro) deacylase
VANAALISALDSAGVDYDVLPHKHTETATEEAEALGIPSHDVAKTLVVHTPGGHVRAVLPASQRIDLGKLSDLVGVPKKSVQLASEEELQKRYPEFELGAVPPLGGVRSDPVVVDPLLTEHASIVFEAGSHDESIRIAAADLVRVTSARVADICLD